MWQCLNSKKNNWHYHNLLHIVELWSYKMQTENAEREIIELEQAQLFVFSLHFNLKMPVRVNFPLLRSFKKANRMGSGVSVWWHEWHIIFCLGMLPKQQRNVMRAVGSHRSAFYEKNSQRPESLFLPVSAVTLRKSEPVVNHRGSSVFWSSRLPVASVIL